MDKVFKDKPRVRVRLKLLTKEEGGRDTSIYDNSGYRPHIVIGNPDQHKLIIGEHEVGIENYLGVSFLGNERILELGYQYEVELALIYHPEISYDAIIKGATFTVREGRRIVAFGEVLSNPEIKD